MCTYSLFAHCNVQKWKMEKYLNRLADLMLLKLEEKNYSYTRFANKCKISRNEIDAIVSRKKNDIKLSTFVKICENLDISYSDIFDFDERNFPSSITISIDGQEYTLKKK